MPPRPIGPQTRNPVQRQILGPNRRAQVPANRDAHGFGAHLPDRLGGQHMRHLGGANAKGQGAECAMGGCMAIAAIHGKARQGQPLFRAHHMHDTLIGIAEAKQAQPVGARVLAQGFDHAPNIARGNGIAAAGGGIVIDHSIGQAGLGHRRAARGQFGKGVVAALVHQVAINPKQRGPIRAAGDFMRLPQLVKQRGRFWCQFWCRCCGRRHHCAPPAPVAGSITGAQWRRPSAPTLSNVISRRNKSGR